jgi:uncharacterized protein YfdQ (DUF2303 family)
MNTTNTTNTNNPAGGHAPTANPSDLSALFDASRDAFTPSVVNVPRGNAEEFPALVVSKGMTALDLSAWMDARRAFPKRAEGQSTHETMESLVSHVLRTADKSTAAWLETSATAAKITVIYDYHLAAENRREKGDGTAYADEDGVARWGKRTAVFSFPISREWQAWRAIAGKALVQSEFAQFVEDHVSELRAPEKAGEMVMALAKMLAQGDEAYFDGMPEAEWSALASKRIGTPSQLVKMARRIALTLDLRSEETRDESGNVSIVYRAETGAEDTKGEVKAKVALPSLLVVEVPVIEGGRPYSMPVRLSTKIEGQRARWVLSLPRLDAAFADAVKDASAAFTGATGVPVFRGKAE